MSLFLTEQELADFTAYRTENPTGQDLFWALLNRVDARASSPGLHSPGSEEEWWFIAGEYLTDAAMAHALKPNDKTARWLRDVTLSLIRRPESDWIGPAFRNHRIDPPEGHLETAHLTWSVAVALDLAENVFSREEADEIRSVLRDRGIPLCRRWLDTHNHMANWRCVLAAGVAVAAAVLDDREEMARAVADYRLHRQAFQPDGSYAESLQYSNYAAFSLMLAREALIRRDPSLRAELPASPWNLLPRWQAASLFYQKPLSGWGSSPRPRSANFNDSAALFRPSADLLLHLAAREGEVCPQQAGLARWLFDTLYAENLAQGPHDRATFGFVNDFGFLAVPLLPQAVAAIPPVEAGLTEVESFSCGDVIARDSWNGRTILAVHGGGEPLHGPGHLHGDLNSFILVHNRERLLVDPGHSCYRNLLHGIEGSSLTHNTCTFLPTPASDDLGLQEDQHGQHLLEQSRTARTRFDPATREPGPPADRGARRLLAERREEVTVIGSEAARLYGKPIKEFSRFWILCGSHALFVVDRIVASRPVQTAWHWLLNNRDGELDLKLVQPDRFVARRGAAGMKFFHLADGSLQTPIHAHVHDAYSPAPAALGEGGSGSGVLLTWKESRPVAERTTVHAIALDGYGPVAGWHLKTIDGRPTLESPGAKVRWSVEPTVDFTEITVRESVSDRSWKVRNVEGKWRFL